MRDVVSASVEFGLRNAPIRWMMLSSIFSGGVAIFAFYAMQPYLLELYGESGLALSMRHRRHHQTDVTV